MEEFHHFPCGVLSVAQQVARKCLLLVASCPFRLRLGLFFLLKGGDQILVDSGIADGDSLTLVISTVSWIIESAFPSLSLSLCLFVLVRVLIPDRCTPGPTKR